MNGKCFYSSTLSKPLIKRVNIIVRTSGVFPDIINRVYFIKTPVPGGITGPTCSWGIYIYGDLALQVGRVSNLRQ
jgi:hypothetical protein